MNQKTKLKPRSLIVAALCVLVVAAMAYFIWSVFGGRTLTRPQRTQAQQYFEQHCSLTVGDTVILPKMASMEFQDTKGNSKKYDPQTGEEQTVTFSSLKNELTFASQPKDTTVTVRSGIEQLFSGTAEEFAAFAPKENGTYTIEVSADFLWDTGSAASDWSFTAVYDTHPSFRLSADTVRQGDSLVLYGENVLEDAEVTVSYPYTPTPHYEGTEMTCLLPFNFLRDPGQYQVTVVCAGETTQLTYTVTETAYEEQHLTVSESTYAATAGSTAAAKEMEEKFYPLLGDYTDKALWSGTFVQPCAGEISTEYGVRRYTNDSATPTRHAGIDIAADEGTPVQASNSGTVVFADSLQMTGWTVMIDHGQGVHTVYYHMSELNCAAGDKVTKGDVIGYVGQTGYATGPHLHFQIMIGDASLSPWYAFDGSAGFYGVTPSAVEEKK